MKDKYSGLKKEYKDTLAAFAGATGWPEERVETLLDLILTASEQKAGLRAAERRDSLAASRIDATRFLLKKYRAIKWSIETGTEHTLKLLEEKEFQRLMELEESVENQRLRSTALLTASNKVLWAQLNAALDCFREFCENDPSIQTRRQYRMIYERYLAPQEKSVQDIVELLHIERAHFFRGVQSAVGTLSIMLFGSRSVEDFFSPAAMERKKEAKRNM